MCLILERGKAEQVNFRFQWIFTVRESFLSAVSQLWSPNIPLSEGLQLCLIQAADPQWASCYSPFRDIHMKVWGNQIGRKCSEWFLLLEVLNVLKFVFPRVNFFAGGGGRKWDGVLLTLYVILLRHFVKRGGKTNLPCLFQFCDSNPV